MVRLIDLQNVIEHQAERLRIVSTGVKRELLADLPTNLESHALIISGIRRCGKSTLLRQLLSNKMEDVLFLNFDTPLLYNFEMADFQLLDEIIGQSKKSILFFDEIQVVAGWELYVRQKLDDGFRLFITGSNASLLSRELGTKLTGRHFTKELFPFSLEEFCRFYNAEKNEKATERYLSEGGFPEYLKTQNPEILSLLTEDIVHRDVAVRHNIRDVSSLKRLLSYLATNVGNLVSATKLTQTLGIKSSATILEYFSFFEQSYMLYLMPKFSYSEKVQMRNPRKIYLVDNGLINAISASFNLDLGRKLENAVFISLRRKYADIFYYNENGKECDFVVFYKQKPIKVMQVCYEVNAENVEREQTGLLDAMDFFQFNEGTIITMMQTDKVIIGNKTIVMIPFHEMF